MRGTVEAWWWSLLMSNLGKEKTAFPFLPAHTAPLSAPPGLSGNVCVPRACPVVPVVSKRREKAISLLHKNSEWWARRGGAQGGFALLIGAGLGGFWVGFFFFFSITEKIKQSAVQQRLLRLYPSFPSRQLTRRGPLFQASANTAPSGGRLPGRGPWRKFYCARG